MVLLWGDMFYIELYRENLQNSVIWNQKARAFDIW